MLKKRRSAGRISGVGESEELSEQFRQKHAARTCGGNKARSGWTKRKVLSKPGEDKIGGNRIPRI